MKKIIFLVLLIVMSNCSSENNEMKIDAIFNEFTAESPGAAVAVLNNSEVIFSKGYGLADLQNHLPISSNTNFRLASVTKQITSMCILLLEKQGMLTLNDSLGKYFTDFPEYGRNITIKQILQHTSGLQDYEDYVNEADTVQLLDKDVVSILQKCDSLYFVPGSQHRYSNSGYAVLSQIVEKVSGISFPEFLHKNIFVPLGMNNSVAFVKGLNEITNRAYGYNKTENGFEFSDQSMTSAVLGDGGIYTSLDDFSKWDKALNQAALIDSTKQAEMWTKGTLTNGEVFDYGYGWRLTEFNGYRLDYHTGSTCGFSNVYMRFPETGLSIIVLMNIRDYPAFDYGKKVAELFLPSKN